MKKIIAVGVILFSSLILKAEVIGLDAYKNIDTYDIEGTLTNDIDVKNKYGTFVILLDEVVSNYTSQIIIPEGAKFSCSYNAEDIVVNKLVKVTCLRIVFEAGNKPVELTLKGVVVSSLDGNSELGPIVPKETKLKIKIANISKITS